MTYADIIASVGKLLKGGAYGQVIMKRALISLFRFTSGRSTLSAAGLPVHAFVLEYAVQAIERYGA